jgi:type II secretory pathway pseudopilin PulG
MLTALRLPNRPRRGVTLVEMLVVVALVVLMMLILVQIFQAALGAMSVSRTTQELDVVLRSIDSMIRSDLSGVTAKMTPPNDPALKSGYFEYMENAPADAQGEDTDDVLAFTTKAPEGQVFTGRQWLSKVIQGPNGPVQTINQAIQPTTVTSQVAEVIYFVRNGNLYRRVLLVAPERATSIKQTFNDFTTGPLAPPNNTNCNFLTSMFGGSRYVSWQGMNDISCRPGGMTAGGIVLAPIPNDLGDLTNRENRAFRPRFQNDLTTTTGAAGPDGLPDDNNGDGIPDYYPTLYYDGNGSGQGGIGYAPNQLVHEAVSYVGTQRNAMNASDFYAFPFIFPGMYSVADNSLPFQRVSNGLGSVHYVPLGNQSPLDVGDNLPVPSATQHQTFWGMPTWRETMAGASSGGGVGWIDPINFVGRSGATTQPFGLKPIPSNVTPPSNSSNYLPPVYQKESTIIPPYFDGAGSNSFVAAPAAAGSFLPVIPNPIWEDDLILTNVRSFDVKAYDQNAPLYSSAANGLFSSGYWDLGYGNVVNGLPGLPQPFQGVDGFNISLPPVGFGHEGRIPPLVNDFRMNPAKPYVVNPANGGHIPNNVGDSSHPSIIRLSHTFDTWSTAYTNAPSSDILLNDVSPSSFPIFPSFPPPYPSPLRGIQIQIRITDPRNERTKVLTIRHDFTDKLTN